MQPSLAEPEVRSRESAELWQSPKRRIANAEDFQDGLLADEFDFRQGAEWSVGGVECPVRSVRLFTEAPASSRPGNNVNRPGTRFRTRGCHSRTYDHTYSEVLNKRSMGLALAALILHEITPQIEQGGNKQYFPLAARLQAMVDNTPLPPDSHFWIFAASLLIGIQRQRFVPIVLTSKDPLELPRDLIALV